MGTTHFCTLSQVAMIGLCIASTGKGQFTEGSNNDHVNVREQSTIITHDPSGVRLSECQCNPVTRNSGWYVQCRLCADSIYETTLSVKLARYATAVASWHSSDENGCTLGDFGKTLFINISCERQILNNIVVLKFRLQPTNDNFNNHEATWMCGGEAKDSDGKTKYFSKWSDSSYCPTKGQGSYSSNLKNRIRLEGVKREAKRGEVHTSPQSCGQFLSCRIKEDGITALTFNISCPRRMIAYCFKAQGNVSYCCYQGMDETGNLSCTIPMDGPTIYEVSISSSLLDRLENHQVQMRFNNSNTYNVNYTCSESSPYESLQNGSLYSTTDDTSRKSENKPSALVIGLSIGGVTAIVVIVVIVFIVYRYKNPTSSPKVGYTSVKQKPQAKKKRYML